MTWESYRRQARLLAAIPLLSGTRRPVGSIALDVGFESQSAFAKALRKLTGKSPLDFRRR
jgi:AraC family transcriptional regulator